MPSAPAAPANVATGTAETPSTALSMWNVMTTTAPSVAPDDTPSVSGDASGFRRNAWNTTPAIANALPTSTDARTRGSRATKNTWASTLSAKGIVRSNTRDKWIVVLPMSGAVRQTAMVSAPKPATVASRRRRRSLGAAKRYHGQVSGARMRRDVGDDTVQIANVGRRQHGVGRSLRDDASVLQQHQFRAQGCRQVQVVRRHHHRRPAVAVQAGEQRRDLELKAEVERGGRLVEQQHVGRLSQRTGDHDTLFLAAAERREAAILEAGGAGVGHRAPGDRQVARALELERAEVRVAAHHHDLERRIVERAVCFLRHDGDPPRQIAP